MEYKQAQQQKQVQKLALTPKIKQSIKLLGMSTKDINDYVDSAISQNPFLKKILDKKERYKKDRSLSGERDFSEEHAERPIAQAADPRLTLLSEIRMLGLKEKELEIVQYLIYEMDDNGYIAVDFQEVADDLSCDTGAVEECLSVIQNMEPAGIGARDIRECLQIQLKRKNKENSLEYTIVTECINEVATNDVDKISKTLKVARQKAQDAISYIKKLNPRPASTLLSKGAAAVIPDLIAKFVNKKLYLELNRNWLPSLGLYNPYEESVDILKDPKAQKFMKENLESAKHLIDNLRRREDTMVNVANYILAHQTDGLTKAGHEIKPLTLKNVAAALNLHPSTISRTVSNKYIQIEDEIIPLSSLLSHGVKKENGEFTSKAAIKKKIEEIVKTEDKKQPLTDSIIQEKLKQEGIVLTRRTIAKYRKALRILPTYLRKKVS